MLFVILIIAHFCLPKTVCQHLYIQDNVRSGRYPASISSVQLSGRTEIFLSGAPLYKISRRNVQSIRPVGEVSGSNLSQHTVFGSPAFSIPGSVVSYNKTNSTGRENRNGRASHFEITASNRPTLIMWLQLVF